MKKVFISLFIIILVLSWAGLVYWAYINFSKHIDFVASSSKMIVSDSESLKSIVLVFRSKSDISNATIQSSCNTATQHITSDNELHFFKFIMLSDNCLNPNFSLKKWDEIFINTNFTLDIQKKSDLFSLIIDYSTPKIVKAKESIDKKVNDYSQYKNLKESLWTDFISLLRKQRIYSELVYKQKVINTVLSKRKEKYEIPVKGYEISDSLNLIPNADRSYRKDYTDGIHHWWDIMAPLWTVVSAIDDGIIIRVVRDFEYEDLSNIKKTDSLTHSEKLRNLDILRWNQVWLKTMKWDVIFYSHLDDVYDNIKEDLFLSRWEDIWTIWVTWVPDKDYDNFHLHFPIQKNPYNTKKAWKYSLEDIMDWDWYLRGLEATDVINGKSDIFKSHKSHDH